MNTMIFVVHKKRRDEYLAVCQCGTRHGPYAKVAVIPPCCVACDEQLRAKRKSR